MKELIRFTVRGKMLNATFLLINLILPAVIAVSLFADVLFLSSDDPVTVSLNHSVLHLYPYLAERSQLEYQISEKPVSKDNAILLYDEGYVLMLGGSNPDISDQIREDLKNALRDIYREKGDLLTEEYLKEIESLENIRIITERNTGSDLYFTAAGTVLYFLLSAFSFLAAADVNYDRSTGNLEMILSSLEPGQYLRARISASWLSLLIQAALAGMYVLLFSLVRFMYDGFSGISTSLPLSSDSFPGIPEIILMIMMMAGDLLISQLIAAFLTLRAAKSSGYNQKVILFQAVLMGIYYLMLHFSAVIMNSRIAAFIPIVNSVRESAFLLEGKIRLLPVAAVLIRQTLIIYAEIRFVERNCFKKISE